MPDKEEKKDVGAIWKMTSRKNTEFLSISLEVNGEKKQFVAFKNHKLKDTHPDYRIFPSDPNFKKKSAPADDQTDGQGEAFPY